MPRVAAAWYFSPLLVILVDSLWKGVPYVLYSPLRLLLSIAPYLFAPLPLRRLFPFFTLLSLSHP